MTINITFGSAQVQRPGAYSQVDSSQMTPTNIGSFRKVALVGIIGTGGTLVSDITQGVTNQVLYYNDPTVAEKELGTGDLVDKMKVSWRHGADLITVSVVPQTYDAATTALLAPADTDWQTAIDALELEAVDGILAVSTEAAIATKVKTHVESMSDTLNRKERRGWFGHAAGLAKADVIALQTTLASERVQIATPAVKDYDASGNLVVKDAVSLAAAYMGLWASKSPEDPITYDYVDFPALEVRYGAQDIIDILTAHIAPTESVPGKGLRIVQGVTASSSEDLTQCELSVSTLKDVMSKDMREFMEDRHVGKAGVGGIEVTIYNDAISRIEGYKKNNWISDYDKKSVKVVKNGTAFSVDWQGSPTLPINDFLITAHFTL